MRKAAVLVLLGLASWAMPARAQDSTFQTALVFGEDDRRRQTHDEIYAFKSVGIVVVGLNVSVGTLLLRGDIVVTSAHVLYDKRGYRRAGRAFFLPDGNNKKAVEVDLERSLPGTTVIGPATYPRDWLILKLKKDVLAENTNQGFTAMQYLPLTPDNFDRLKNRIVHISFDFRRRPLRKRVNHNCRLHDKRPGDLFWDSPTILLHDCDLDRPDNSGSPLVIPDDGVYYLVAMHQGGHWDWRGRAFDARVNPMFAVGLGNGFRDALETFLAMHEPGFPEPR